MLCRVLFMCLLTVGDGVYQYNSAYLRAAAPRIALSIKLKDFFTCILLFQSENFKHTNAYRVLNLSSCSVFWFYPLVRTYAFDPCTTTYMPYPPTDNRVGTTILNYIGACFRPRLLITYEPKPTRRAFCVTKFKLKIRKF